MAARAAAGDGRTVGWWDAPQRLDRHFKCRAHACIEHRALFAQVGDQCLLTAGTRANSESRVVARFSGIGRSVLGPLQLPIALGGGSENG
jgi:hypothetical protein